MMKSGLFAALAAAALVCTTGLAHADAFVAGQKIDSGLGALPHYSKWADASGRIAPAQVKVAGESLDSGLGELPHYSKWADPSGRTATGRLALLSGPAR